MKRTAAIAGILTALAFAAGLVSGQGAYQYYKFKTGNFPYSDEVQDIKTAIKFFSGTVSGFYATGGSLAGLNIFPAEKMVKRRIFQDITHCQETGKLAVMDRDRSTVRQVTLMSPDRAVAVVDENWFIVLQDYKSRRQISDKKANLITVRYLMKKMWGKWIVADYYVYVQGEELAPLRTERLPAW